jgi:hypothetical protein
MMYDHSTTTASLPPTNAWTCPKQVSSNTQLDFVLDGGPIVTLGGDASATHGDGVCAVA